MHHYAEVIIDLVSNAVDRPFHYRIPPELQGKIKPGIRVSIPLGNRGCQGYVLRLLKKTAVDSLRDISAIIDPDPLLTQEQLALAHWISMRFYCRKIDALHAMIPASFRKGKRPGDMRVIELTPGAAGEELSRAPSQRQALDLLQQKGTLPRNELIRLGINSQTIRSLEKKGLVRVVSFRPGYKEEKEGKIDQPPLTKPYPLREEQAGCFEKIREALDCPKAKRMLLHGITASGKTEIYLQSIAYCQERGQTAMILVPEISLTPQMIDHFEGRFPGRVAVLHSRLSVAEKNRQWHMILSGKARVVLGARSAVFAPLDNIGLIIIDEEHETTYKQEEAPRYHARDVAWWRARYNKAVLILGSATPALES